MLIVLGVIVVALWVVPMNKQNIELEKSIKELENSLNKV